jgi:uncharacterized membrane protein
MARRIIPSWRPLFRLIMTAINNGRFFIFAALIIGAVLPLITLLFFRKKIDDSQFKNPAEKRKYRAENRKRIKWNIITLAGIILCILSMTVIKNWNEREVTLSPAEDMEIAGREARIPITQIEDGHLHRFAWNASDGTEVRFIVIKKSASAYGVGLDACDICGNTGYYERKDGVVCKLCDVVMNISTIGFKGGCNPVPLAYTVSDGKMIISLEDLENEKARFK